MKLLRNNYKKAVSVLLSAALIMALFTIVPFTANAADTTEISGTYTVPENGYTFNNRVVCDGDVTIVLTEGATLNIPKGINLTGDASLTINGNGSLMINDVDDNNAGIGGDEDKSLSSLTINGGTINVNGGANAAGIGGGKNGFVGKVTINGGNVTANGGDGGAGIGTGYLEESNGDQNNDDGVYIYGGSVLATGGEDGAGIGDGKLTVMTEGEAEFAVEITGGTVRAEGNNNIGYSGVHTAGKPSIGGESVTISISGGDVYAGVGGLASNDTVILSWKKISDKFYFDGIFTTVELKKEFIEQGTENTYSPDTYEEGTDSHPLEHKTLIPPQDGFVADVPYIDENGAAQTVDCAMKADENTTVFESGWYVIAGDEYSYTFYNENRIVCDGDVNLIIPDGFKLKTDPGITVNEGSSLTVYGQSGCTGELVCGVLNSSLERAGIGGDDEQNSGSITLVGGKITADGGYGAAGIGGGNGGSGTVSVKCSEQYPVEITSTGGTNAAGIGGGYNGSGNVDIYGGNVTAAGGQRGAGIGGGRDLSGELNLNNTVNIYGGSVYADGGQHGAGIGTGYEGGKATVNISGGYIEATGVNYGSDSGAGIGGGLKGVADVTISGGEIHATGGEYASGIGSGDRDLTKTSSVTVSGGKVYANGGLKGAGIGGGFKSICTVTISGGFVYATRGNDAFGIGNGYNSDPGNSEISLSWTNQDDSIYSSSYGGNVTLEKAFKDQSDTIHQAGAVSDNSEIDGTTLTPFDAYAVTWLNYDGTLLKTDYVENGSNPLYDGDTPEKPGSDGVRNVFKGWTDGETSYANGETLPAVTADVTYTAEFDELSYVEQVEPYIDENGAYILGVKEHYVIGGKNYAVNEDGSVGNELPSVELSYFEFGLINNDAEYRINYYTGPTENLSEIVVPKTFNGKKITVLGNTVNDGGVNSRVVPQGTHGFALVLNENITKITNYSFYAVQITGVTGDTSGLNSIGYAAFSWANSGGGYSLDIKLDYKGRIYMDELAFNNMTVNALISHDTTFSKTSLGQKSITYSFSDAHKYGTPAWTWADNYSTATAKFTCTNSRCGHKETVVDTDIDVEETYEKIIYTASVEFEGKTYSNKKEVQNEIGSWLVGHSLSLDGDIGVNFYMYLSDEIASSSTAYMEFHIPAVRPENQLTTRVYVNKQSDSSLPCAYTKTIDNNTYYVFKCRVAAKEMTSDITAQIKDDESNKTGTVYHYCVKDYADYLLNNAYEADGTTVKNQTFADAVPLVKKLINYGAYAQMYFDRNYADLANADLTDKDRQLADVTAEMIERKTYTENLDESVTYDGATLSLKSETSLSLYFISESEGLTFSCIKDNEKMTVQVEHTGKQYIARIRGIAANKLNDEFTLMVMNGETELGSVTYSPMKYCYNTLYRAETIEGYQEANVDFVNVVKALYWYYDAAKEYFTPKS